MNRGDYDGAIITFGEAIGFDMTNMRAYMKRGQCFYKLKNYEESIKDFSHIIENEPHNSNAYLWRGTANSKLGDHDATVRDYLAAIRLDPQLAKQYQENGGADAVQDGNTGKGRQPGTKASENKASVSAYEEAMAQYLKQKDSDRLSGGQTEQAMRTAAEDTRPEGKRRRTPEMDADKKAANERLPDDKDVLRDRIAKLNSAVEADNRNPHLYFRRALLYAKMESYDQAISDLTKSLDLDPMNANVYIARARVYHHQGQPDLAKADLEKARSVDPTVPAKIRLGD
jgi:tetratricopeptide (TPR) repeat protein